MKPRLRILSIAAFLSATAIAGGSLLQDAPIKATARVNPLKGNSEAARAGRKLYARECAACHGANREGGREAPPLERPDVQTASPGALFWVLRNGSRCRNMPSFAHLPEDQRWQIVTYLQSVRPHSAGEAFYGAFKPHSGTRRSTTEFNPVTENR